MAEQVEQLPAQNKDMLAVNTCTAAVHSQMLAEYCSNDESYTKLTCASCRLAMRCSLSTYKAHQRLNELP